MPKKKENFLEKIVKRNYNNELEKLLEEKQFEDTDDEYSDIVMKIGLHDERFKKFIIKYDKLPTDKKEVLCDFFEKFID